MNKKIITAGIVFNIVIILGITIGISMNLTSTKANNKIEAVSSNKESSDSTSSEVGNLTSSGAIEKESVTVQTVGKANAPTTKNLTKAEINELLSKMDGLWYNLSDEAIIKAFGPTQSIYIYKKADSYTFVRELTDLSIGRKIRGIKQLEGQGKYSFVLYNVDGYEETDYINFSNDFNTMYVTSPDDKNAKYVKETKETTQFVQLIYLSGEYKDDKNRDYVLNKDGIAIWPDNTFKFSVDITEKLFPESSPYRLETCYLLAMDQKGKETMRYIYERIGSKLCIYKTVVDSKNNYRKGDLAFNLTKLDGVRDLDQKAIDMVAKKYNAIAFYIVPEPNIVYYKSELGEICFSCSKTSEKDEYKVSIFKDVEIHPTKEFIVNVITGSVEECK